MTTPTAAPVLLTVRGTLKPTSNEAARVLHNETAGSEPGIAAARALGDLSHKVYSPVTTAGSMSNAKSGELLFMDTWVDAGGIMQFFSNPHVGEQGARLFGSRDATVWMPATGSFRFNYGAPMNRAARFVGMIRAPISSPEAAIQAFDMATHNGLREARRRGQISHEIFIKMAAPGDASPLEVLGVDVWFSLDGLKEHYADATHVKSIAATFSGPPAPSVWQQAEGDWSEW